VALAVVALGGETSKGVGLLGLEELVGSLLPLLGHGGRSGLGEGAHGSEDDEREEDTSGSVGEDLLALAGRGEGAGAVGTEGDVVGCVGRECNVSLSVVWTLRVFLRRP